MGFAAADRIFEEIYSSQPMQHVPIEPHAALAQVGADGKTTIWSSTQCPYIARADLALALEVPPSRPVMAVGVSPARA